MSKKEQIREAAIKIIAKEGFYNATTDKISKEAKVAVGTLYNYFSSKEQILNYIFEVEFQKRVDFYHNMKTWQMDWFLKINGILNFHLQEIKKEPAIAKIILTERINAHRYGLEALTKLSQLTSIIADILQQGISENKVRPCDVKVISLIISGFLDALIYEIAATDTFADPEQSDLAQSNIVQSDLAQSVTEFSAFLKLGLATAGDGSPVAL